MWFKVNDAGVTIAVRTSPNASKDAIAGVVGDRLLVKLTAPPVEGRANKALGKLLAKALGVSPSSVSIVRGHTSRDKIVSVTGIDEATVRSLV